MEPTPEAKYAAFEEQVKRTIYIDNLSPQVTESVLKAAIDQFGTVKNVKLIPNYLEPKIPLSALVELESHEKAIAVISGIAQFPFMILGMPRPVRARAAEIEMFDDRPVMPGRRIQCRWLDPSDPDYVVAKKLKRLTQTHAAEASFLLKRQADREEKLHKQQEEMLKANFKKFEMIDGVANDNNKSALRLARHYNMRIFGE